MSDDEIDFEPVPGLPEAPPEGEEILWQGSPDWWMLARDAMGFWWVAGYFAALMVWRFLTVVDLVPLGQAIGVTLPFAILGAIVCGLVALFAYIQARLSVYTVTTSRVAMRIGAALTVTLNVPFKQLANASLDLRRNGTGTIAFETLEQMPLSYLVCWPHVRPWKMRTTEPALRCIKDAEHVAEIIAEAAQARINVPQVQRRKPELTVAAE